MECTTSRVSPNVNHGFWVITLCHCRFINCNTCTTLAGDVDSRRGYACVGAGGMWEMSILSAQFCCESKTGLKNKRKTVSISQGVMRIKKFIFKEL